MDHQNELHENVEIETLSEADLEAAAGGGIGMCSAALCSNTDPE